MHGIVYLYICIQGWTSTTNFRWDNRVVLSHSFGSVHVWRYLNPRFVFVHDNIYSKGIGWSLWPTYSGETHACPFTLAQGHELLGQGGAAADECQAGLGQTGALFFHPVTVHQVLKLLHGLQGEGELPFLRRGKDTRWRCKKRINPPHRCEMQRKICIYPLTN